MATRKTKTDVHRLTPADDALPLTFPQAAKGAGLDCRAGLGAIAHHDRAQIKVASGARRLTGSLNLDGHYQASEPHACRWDYGVGVSVGNDVAKTSEERAYWIEPHPASSTAEVTRMLRKLDWLVEKLRQPDFGGLYRLTFGEGHAAETPFIWLYSGKNRILPQSQEAKRLQRRGLSLPRRMVEL